MRTVIIATPHPRNDGIVSMISLALPGVRVIRFTKPDELFLEEVMRISPDWIFFPHWSWVINSEIFENFKCVIFHMTDLPYGRGGRSTQNLIIEGHESTMLTALMCVKNIDAGPIYAKVPLSLSGTAEDILSRASLLISNLIVWIVNNDPKPVEQVGEVVEFKRRHANDGDLMQLNKLKSIYDYIRMLDGDGYPSAFIESDYARFEFKNVHMIDGALEATVRIRMINNE